MDEVKRDEIIYEEGWHETAVTVKEETPVDEEKPLADPQKGKAARVPPPLLISLQLSLCLLAALILFLLKAMDSDGYRRFMAYYREEEQKPLISRDVFKAVDVGALFSQNAVTIDTTPDEAAPLKD